MRFNRIAVGFIGGLVGIPVLYLEIRFGLLDWLDWELTLAVALAAGCSVLWLADRLGVLAQPPAHANFLRADEEAEGPSNSSTRPK